MKTFMFAMATGIAVIVALSPMMPVEAATTIAGTIATAIMVLSGQK